MGGQQERTRVGREGRDSACGPSEKTTLRTTVGLHDDKHKDGGWKGSEKIRRGNIQTCYESGKTGEHRDTYPSAEGAGSHAHTAFSSGGMSAH